MIFIVASKKFVLRTFTHCCLCCFRIMVLDAGEIKEFSPPQDLLSNQNSIFYSLAKEANVVS